MTKLTPDRLDEILTPPRRDRIIWTAEAIGKRIGVSADFVRKTLVHQEGSPVKRIGTRYCAVEADLIAFFRSGR